MRNEYGLGQPELYKEANREDPKAVLDGLAVAGLVGILRQLGDLAEYVFFFVLNFSVFLNFVFISIRLVYSIHCVVTGLIDFSNFEAAQRDSLATSKNVAEFLFRREVTYCD